MERKRERAMYLQPEYLVTEERDARRRESGSGQYTVTGVASNGRVGVKERAPVATVVSNRSETRDGERVRAMYL